MIPQEQRVWTDVPSSSSARLSERRLRYADPHDGPIYSNGRVYHRNPRGDLVSLGVDLRLG